MNIDERLAEFEAEAEKRGLDLSQIEIWERFPRMMRLGYLLGYTDEETLAPLRG